MKMEIIQGTIDCRPEDVDYDSSRIEALNKHLQKMIEQKKIDGSAYCILRNGKIIAHNSIGTAHYIDGDRPMLPDTVHRVASVTKTFTTVALMKLIEDGYTRLDIKVGEILPQMAKPPFQDITLFHLLTHTSGLFPDDGCVTDDYHCSHWEFVEEASKHWKQGEEFDWLSNGLRGGMHGEPGQWWQYCSFAFSILGEVIKALSGVRAEEFIVEQIVKPLNMKDTGFIPTKEQAARSNILYHDNHCKEELLNLINGKQREAFAWEAVPGTGGRMFSTPYDLIRFANMLLHKGTLDDVRILGRKTFEKMTTSSLTNIPDHCWGATCEDRKYGIGFDMREGPGFHYSKGSFMHEGAGACSMNIDPVENLAAVWFVPFADEGWYSECLYNVNNIIWSGLK